MEYKSTKESQTVITELMVPSYANFGGKVHGGLILSLMNKVAYVCATRHSGTYCVTVAVEGVEFLSPVEVGDLLTIKASVNFTGTTTMIVGMRVEAQNPRTSLSRHTNSCFFTMLAKDDFGANTTVPGLILQNELELRRFCEGLYLRNISLERRRVMKSDLYVHSQEELRGLCAKENCSFLF